MSKDATKAVQSGDSEVDQIRKCTPRTALGEERTEAADGEEAVGGDDSFEIGLVIEFKW